MATKSKFDPRKMMEKAIEVMKLSINEPRADKKASPLVGTVLVKPDGTLDTAFRGELRHGDHAEYTLLERKHRDERLDRSVLFSTLEPCAPGARKHPKLACAERIVNARIAEVWVGIEDPDPAVDGHGIRYLEESGIKVHLFDRDLQEQIRRANKEFQVRTGQLGMAGDQGTDDFRRVRRWHESAESHCQESLEEADRARVVADGGRWSRHPLRGGAVMTAGGAAELRRPLNRAEHQATMARLARSPRTWNRAIHRAIVARFGEAGCFMTAACNKSTVEDAALAWFRELAHSHPGSRDNSRDRVSQAPERAPASFPAIYPASMAGRVFQRIPSRNAPWYPMP